ncbi:MAG TPA: hypothetical protein VMV03_12410 [Spirochaetia bacterium]|nr:hypothetical protein [Spirochaetia bacterium]
MAKRELVGDGFETRRRNEELAFLVVKFLRAYLSFQDIRAAFLEAAGASHLAGSGLFEKVRDLEESLAFELKEKAHRLFRSSSRQGNGGTATTPAALKRAFEARSIDSYVGTGYHLLLILRESLYQIDRYTPELEKEKEELARFAELARTSRASFTADDLGELEQLHALDAASLKIRDEAENLAGRMVERCDQLFRQTAGVLRRFMKIGDDNEILLLNLLRNRDLLEKVYGEGAAESIFTELCRAKRVAGKTGTEKAVNYVRSRCGNITGLPGGKETPSRSS